MFDRIHRGRMSPFGALLIGLLMFVSADPAQAARALEAWTIQEVPSEQETDPPQPVPEAEAESGTEQEAVAPPDPEGTAVPVTEPGTQVEEPAPTEEPVEDAQAARERRAQVAADKVASKALEDRQFEAAKDRYGLAVLIPAGLAILLAILTRQVVISLALGVLAGAYMLVPLLSVHPDYAKYAEAGGPVVAGFRLFAEEYLFGAVQDGDHLMILLFTLSIGFMIGVIGRNGGTQGLVKIVVGGKPTRRKGAVSTWFAGLVVFFDDYANTMIVGPTMRSVFDKLKLSRAKLAYIVDSTAAPVSSIALIGTWVGAEVGFIKDGFEGLGDDTPEFLQSVQPMDAFIASIPYRYYPILALVLVLIIAWTGRDFGPMRKSEQRAFDDQPPEDGDEFHSTEVGSQAFKARPLLGVLPILVLVFGALAVLWVTGTEALPGADADAREAAEQAVYEKQLADPDISEERLEAIRQRYLPPEERTTWEFITSVISSSNSYLSIFYGAILSAVIAVILTLLWRAAKMREVGEAAVQGMSHMFPALVILVFAWCLSAISTDLALGRIVGEELNKGWFDPVFLPLAVFICSAVISFASGSSWTTMGILCPMTVQIAARLGTGAEFETAGHSLEYFYASVGSVLAGAIFGDHCSPISDTTVLSSVSAGVSHEEHVWTQMPYAILTAVVAMGIGDVACRYYDQPWYVGLPVGAVVLLVFMLMFGRKPKDNGPRPVPVPDEATVLDTQV